MKKSTRFVSSLLVTGALLLAACGDQEQATPASAENVQVVKVAQNIVPNIPYSYSEDGKMIGYTVDYLKLVDEYLEEYVFEYEQVESEPMLIGTATGKYDLAANFYFRNPEREEKYAFGEYAHGYSITGIATKTSHEDITSLDDFQGKTLAPLQPSGGTYMIIDNYNQKHPGKEIVLTPIDQFSDADALKSVDSGKYDGHFLNTHSFDNVNGSLGLDLKIAGVISKEPIWVLFNKEHANSELVKRVDEATKALIEDGTLPALSEEWFGLNFFEDLENIQENYQFD